jgi:hypothetical protein
VSSLIPSSPRGYQHSLCGEVRKASDQMSRAQIPVFEVRGSKAPMVSILLESGLDL